MSLDELKEKPSDMRGGLLTAGGETGPVIEVDDTGDPILSDNAISAVDADIERTRGLGAYLMETLCVER